MDQSVRRQIYAISLLLFAIVLLAVLPLILPNGDNNVVDIAVDVVDAPALETVPDPFEDVVLSAHSAYVYDVRAGKPIFEMNGDLQLPLASVTKLMTALIVHEALDDTASVVITPDALAREGDSGFYIQERWSVRDLLDFTLLSSSNDGAYALASVAGTRLASAAEALGTTTPEEYKTPADPVAFIERMNEVARELGLTQTYFLNESGLDFSTDTAGAYGSARDMAHLMGFLVRETPELISATRENSALFESQSAFVHTAANTNPLVAHLPGLLASKTGYTDLAGGNLVVAIDVGPAYPVVVSVLGSGFDERFSDVEALVDAVFKYYESR